MLFRSDIAKELGLQPPKTWEDYLAFAKAVSEKKLTTDDGKPVYGSCIAKKKAAQSYWMVTSVASAFIQSQGTGQGAFFDLETFKPLYNTVRPSPARWRSTRRPPSMGRLMRLT